LPGVQRRIVFILAGVLIASGCSRRETQVAIGNREQVLHIGNKDEPSDLDPHINTASSTSAILHALFEGLVEFAGDGITVRPGVAERWEVSGDGRTLTFHLRGDGRWSNGEPITAQDFRDSFVRVLDPELGCEEAAFAFSITGAKDFAEGRSKDPSSVGVRAQDAHTLVLLLEHPAPYLLKFLTSDPFFPLYMPSLDANGGRRQRGGPWTRPGVLVGNGPFVLSEWRPNAYVSVKRNPSFWDAGRVRLSEVRFYPTDDENAEERAFRTGQLHVTYRLPKAKVPVYAAEHPGELHVLPILRTNYITFNVRRAPFTDPRVRRALSLAIDRDRLVRAALGELGTPAYTMVRPGAGGFTSSKGFRYDPAEASRLLGEAGFQGGRGMAPIELTLNGTTGTTLEVAEVLQNMWLEALGVHVVLRPLEFKVYLNTEREKQFQFLFEGYSYIPDPHDMLQGIVTGDPQNDGSASDAAFDAAMAASDGTPDERLRSAAFEAAEAANADGAYYVPVYYSNRCLLVAPGVRGWQDNAIPVIDWRTLYLEP
jgi:oligopeptide transport system substrate-binding protein